MNHIFWRIIAIILSSKSISGWLIHRAQRTPYTHIMSPDGLETYMGRWWLFNPYPAQSDGRKRKWGDWVPSVRIHHIMRADDDRHHHDHPWNARTIILRGGYVEHRGGENIYRMPGDTATLMFGEYHRIDHVLPMGAWTLFITWRYQGTWGFEVDGVKVPWRKYLGIEDGQS